MKAKKTVNKLKHIIDCADKEGNQLNIRISLDDDSHNGHNDFSIICTAWQKGKPRNDKYIIYGGSAHAEIIKARPDLKIFTDLHLSDVNGTPICAVENGFYHIFNSDIKIAADYLRITEFEAKKLKETSPDKIIFGYNIMQMGLPSRWKSDSLKAIQLLEEWRGEKFQDNSKKLQSVKITGKILEKIVKKQKEGFYTPNKIASRKKAEKKQARQKALDELKENLDIEIENQTNEYNVKRAVLLSGLSIDNFIYYHHINEGVFNWSAANYYKESTITEDQLTDFFKFLKTYSGPIPVGITFKLNTP